MSNLYDIDIHVHPDLKL